MKAGVRVLTRFLRTFADLLAVMQPAAVFVAVVIYTAWYWWWV
jgi:hypothetical protein